MEGPEKDFEAFLERYSTCRGISKEEAREHQLAKDVKAYYQEVYDGKYEIGGIL